MTRIAVEIIWNEYFEEKSKIIELGFNSILDVPFDMVSHSTNLKTTRYITGEEVISIPMCGQMSLRWLPHFWLFAEKV